MTTPTQGPPRYKRRLRNYLLDKSFQLKYAGFIFGVAAVGPAGHESMVTAYVRPPRARSDIREVGR